MLAKLALSLTAARTHYTILYTYVCHSVHAIYKLLISENILVFMCIMYIAQYSQVHYICKVCITYQNGFTFSFNVNISATTEPHVHLETCFPTFTATVNHH